MEEEIDLTVCDGCGNGRLDGVIDRVRNMRGFTGELHCDRCGFDYIVLDKREIT